MTRMPTLFLSHGSPMHAVDPGKAGDLWQGLNAALPKPRALVIASAHWETARPMLTGSAHPDTIHDFGGFPEALYRIRYPAPGAPDVARRAAELLREQGFDADIDPSRGLDHGAWVPLLRMFPDADIPVVQLSIQTELGPGHHLRVGRALQPLAADDVLILASGHTTHNLRDWMMNRRGGEPLSYAQEFSTWLHDALASREMEALVAYRERAPGAQRAHPTEEHFLPIFIAIGAAGEDATPEPLLRAFEGSALAMDSYLFRPR